jgi:hypothetical protein
MTVKMIRDWEIAEKVKSAKTELLHNGNTLLESGNGFEIIFCLLCDNHLIH